MKTLRFINLGLILFVLVSVCIAYLKGNPISPMVALFGWSNALIYSIVRAMED